MVPTGLLAVFGAAEGALPQLYGKRIMAAAFLRLRFREQFLNAISP